jgi:hypothetical protein
MFRLLTSFQVRMGEYKDFYSSYQQLVRLSGEKGFRPASLWGATLGAMNSTMMSTDYDTISDFWSDVNAYQADADYMKIWRHICSLVDGHPNQMLWESAGEIA